MRDINRREFSLALTALAGLGGKMAEAQAPTAAGSAETLTHSEIFPSSGLTAKLGTNGIVSRAVIHGTLPTGEFVEVHETFLPAGQMPHPPHRHTHSEFLLIREGRLEVESEGQRGVVEPGGVVFTASGVLHGLKNVGETPAQYFVVAVGVQQPIT